MGTLIAVGSFSLLVSVFMGWRYFKYVVSVSSLAFTFALTLLIWQGNLISTSFNLVLAVLVFVIPAVWVAVVLSPRPTVRNITCLVGFIGAGLIFVSLVASSVILDRGSGAASDSADQADSVAGGFGSRFSSFVSF